jgi:hypothetical protein
MRHINFNLPYFSTGREVIIGTLPLYDVFHFKFIKYAPEAPTAFNTRRACRCDASIFATAMLGPADLARCRR